LQCEYAPSRRITSWVSLVRDLILAHYVIEIAYFKIRGKGMHTVKNHLLLYRRDEVRVLRCSGSKAILETTEKSLA